MKDEIKEILDYISSKIWKNDVLVKYNFIELENYIDSLQQENVNLKGEVFNLKAELIQMQDELKQERTYSMNRYIDMLDEEVDAKDIIEEELENCKNKIDKAIEYIENPLHQYNGGLFDHTNFRKELVKILQGKSDE